MEINYLSAVLKHTHEKIILLDTDCCIKAVSQTFSNALKKTASQLLNKDYLPILKHYIEPTETEFKKIKGFFSKKENKNSFSMVVNNQEVFFYKLIENEQHVGYMTTINTANDMLEQLRIVSNVMPGYFYWKDKDGHYLGCNPALLDMLGFTKTEMIGKTDYDIWPEQADKLRLHDESVMKNGNMLRMEEQVVIEGSGKHYYTAVKMPLRDKDNNIIGIIGNSLDITEEVKLQQSLAETTEAAQTANLAKSEFLANMSHDLRTPLTGIIALSEALASLKGGSPEVEEYSNQLIQASQRLLNLLNDILELAKADQHSYSGKVKLFEPKKLIQSVVDLLFPSITSKHLLFTFEFDKKIPQVLLGHSALLHRVLLNLLSNAIKFTEIGSIGITTHLIESQEEYVVLEIKIQDTGIGIPDDKYGQIFEPFSRLTASFSGHYQGAGLGLYIVKQFIEKMGGEISLKSAEDEGSQFSCILPFQIPKENDASQFIKNQMENKHTLINKIPISKMGNILLVEDDTLSSKAISILLGQLNEKIDICSSGEDALIKLKSNNYDLVYLDIGLPKMSGDQVATEFRKNENKSKNAGVPIIALTAHADDEVKQLCLESGIDLVLQKPLNLSEAKKIHLKYIQGREYKPIETLSRTEETEQNLSVIDLKSTEQFISDPSMIKEVLSILADELADIIEKLNIPYENHDWEMLLKMVHKLHSSTCYSGTPRLKNAASKLEDDLRSEQTHVDEYFSNLKKEINNFLEAFNKLEK